MNTGGIGLKLFFALGPGDVVGDIRRIRDRNDDSGETSITFSEQVYDYVKAKDYRALAVSHHSRRDAIDVGSFSAMNLPKRFVGRSGLMFQISQIVYGVTLVRRARCFGADIAIIDAGGTHNFMLVLFRLLGIRVAVNFHNVRWPIGYEPTGLVRRSVRALDSWFFRNFADAAMGCSPECGNQARADGADRLPYFGWCGQYSADGFDPARPKPRDDVSEPRDDVFRVMFAGRVEQSKGVFDLVDIATALSARCTRPVAFHVCGEGSALQPLRDLLATRDLGRLITVHGRLERAELLDQYTQADAVIVPTRGNFCEGMPLVCAEAMLAGCPVVTSRLSNALPVIGDAIAEAVPEDVESYVAALLRLAEDPVFYEERRAACAPAALQFLDRTQGYDVAIDRVVSLLSAAR